MRSGGIGDHSIPPLSLLTTSFQQRIFHANRWIAPQTCTQTMSATPIPSGENLQPIADQLVTIVSRELEIEFPKRVIVSSTETNDVHIDAEKVLISPFFLTLGCSGNPIEVIRYVFHLAFEFDAERQRRTLHAINELKFRLRSCISKLRELDPDSLDEIISEEYFGDSKELNLELQAEAA